MTAPGLVASVSTFVDAQGFHHEIEKEALTLKPLKLIEELAVHDSGVHPQQVGSPPHLDTWLERRGVLRADYRVILPERSRRERSGAVGSSEPPSSPSLS